MPSDQLSKYSAKIKDVYIELKDYEFFHSPYSDNKAKKRFIGRNKVKDRIISILKHTNIKAGSYLITGFRGMGKTSVIREALEDYNAIYDSEEKNRNVVEFLDNAISALLKLARITLCYVFGYILISYLWGETKFAYLLDYPEDKLPIAVLAILLSLSVILAILLNELEVWSKTSKKTEKVRNKKGFRIDSERLIKARFVVSIVPLLILNVFFYFFTSKQLTTHTIILLNVFIFHLICAFLFKKVFEATWNSFKIIFVIFLFTVSAIFFLNYDFICDGFGCSEKVGFLMKTYFPVEQDVWQFKSWLSLIRIIFSVFFSFIILTVILFFLDLIFLLRDRSRVILTKLWLFIKNYFPSTKKNKSTQFRKYEKFEINLSQDSLNEMDVLKRITTTLEEFWIENKYTFGNPSFNRTLYFPSRFILKKLNRPRKENVRQTYDSVLEKLRVLKNRMSGQVTSRQGLRFSPSIKTELAGKIAELEVPLGTFENNDETSYPVANAKEAEDMLRGILDEIDKLRSEDDWEIPHFAFIIDELDKIGPQDVSGVQEKEYSNPVLDQSIYAQDTNRVRQRREAVAKLLANLKGFLNVVKAKFFFIGGREMFDADLADIADRESFYSSIFNDVIYVESFFKDSIDMRGHGKGGITEMTEAYLCNIILNNLNEGKENEKDELSLKTLYRLMSSKNFDVSSNESYLYFKSNLKPANASEKINRHKTIFKLKSYSAWLIECISKLAHLEGVDNKFEEFARTKEEINKKLEEIKEQPEKVSTLKHKHDSKFKRYAEWSIKCISKLANLKDVDNALEESEEINKQKYKAIFTLQNYIIYLTYRSNGTPKKLTGLTEQLIVRGPSSNGCEKTAREKKNSKFFSENVVILHEPEDANKKPFNPLEEDLSEKLFLKFGFNTQYEIGLTSNLYRPYLIANSRHLKSFGDKLLFSSTFIIDHLLKFHPFGFSWRNLELIPEVVLVNREPNLREFIEELMRFYSLNYIRDTVSGIFEYRFRSIIRRELIHLSKTSDLSSAAFNFTLDESLATKRHYKKKLIEIREKYKDYSPIAGDNQFVHSLCFIQTILGDLHFYDKEYDEAVLWYTESIQALRHPSAVTERLITRHQFLLWLRNKLKLGLTLEKMRAFDSAFSLYKTLILDTERYFKIIISKKESDDVKEPNSQVSEDHRTIQMVSMPFVALLAVTEKARNDGITYTNLFTNREDFLRTINVPREALSYVSIDKTDDGKTDLYRKYHYKEDDRKFDFYRKYYLIADYYNNVGSILYYKNCQFSHFFQKEEYWLDAFKDAKKSEGKNPLITQQENIYNKSNKREHDYFPSLTSFNYYWNSLYFLLKYHQERISEFILKAENKEVNKENIEEVKDNLLALCTGYLLPECIDMSSSSRLYYVANVVSKIGDSILASLKAENFSIPVTPYNPLDITDPDPNIKELEKDPDALIIKVKQNRVENIKKFRELVGENLFTAETVLYTYKLAAALYKRAGHTSYYASHLTKILYVIKDLIELDKAKNKNEKNYNAELIKRLSLFLVAKKENFLGTTEESFLITKNEANQKARKVAKLLRDNAKPLKFMRSFFGKAKYFSDLFNPPSYLNLLRDKTKTQNVVLFQNEKTQYVVVHLYHATGLLKKLLIEKIEKIAQSVFKATTWNNEVSNRPQILKYREIFGIKADKNKDREVIYSNLNNISDNKEVVVLVESIKLKLCKDDPESIETFRKGRSIISAYGPINNRYQRMLELKYRTERCYFIMNSVLNLGAIFIKTLKYDDKGKSNLEEINATNTNLEKIILKDLRDPNKDSQEPLNIHINNVVAFLIQEGLFCSTQLIKMIKLYNPGYVIGYSFIAEAHRRMGDWCQAYEHYTKIIGFLSSLKIDKSDNEKRKKDKKLSPEEIKQLENKCDEIDEKIKNLNNVILKECLKLKDPNARKEFETSIKDLLGSEALIYMEPKNHYEAATQYYYKMIQLHTDGKSYKEKLHEIFMLEDDYNDNTAHYTIASERMRINTGNIRKKINILSNYLDDSKLYKYEFYLTPGEKENRQNLTSKNDRDTVMGDYLKFFAKKIEHRIKSKH